MFDQEPIDFEVETLDSDGNHKDTVVINAAMPSEAVAEVIEHLPPGKVEWEFDDEDIHAIATLYLDNDAGSGKFLTVSASSTQH